MGNWLTQDIQQKYGIATMSRNSQDHDVLRFGDYSIEPSLGALYRNGRQLKLRPKSFDVLLYLASNPDRLVSKDELLDAVWDNVVTEDSVTQCIVEIRRVLDDSEQDIVRTVPRRGFVFAAPVADALSSARSEGNSRRTAFLLGGVGAVALLALLLALLGNSGEKPEPPADTAAAETHSIAVLRFADFSTAQDQTYLADGLADEIRDRLARSSALRVTARESSFAFPPDGENLASIGEDLSVRYLLVGSLQRHAESLSVAARLIDAASGEIVWSNAYERPFEKLAELQQEIAVDAAGALAVELPVRKRSSTSAAAHDRYLLGQYLYHRRLAGDIVAAEAHLEEAVSLDASHAPAWRALAATYMIRSRQELNDPSYRFEERGAALMRSLNIDPESGETWIRLSRYFNESRQFGAARQAMIHALDTAPNDPLVLATLANLHQHMGESEEGLELHRRLVDLNPLSRVYRRNYALFLAGAGRYEEGLAQMQLAADLAIDSELASDICSTLIMLRRPDEALAAFQEVSDGPERDKLAIILNAGEEQSDAATRLKQDRSSTGYLRLAEIAAYRNDADSAFHLLDRIVETLKQHPTRAHYDNSVDSLLASPFLPLLHADPRWTGVLDRVRQFAFGDFLGACKRDNVEEALACLRRQSPAGNRLNVIAEVPESD